MEHALQESMIDPHFTVHQQPCAPEPERTIDTKEWETATETLREMLETNGGIVSFKALRPELEKRGVANAKELCLKLKLFNFDDSQADLPQPSFRYYYHGRSFYSEAEHQNLEADKEAAAEEAEREIEAADDSCDETTVCAKKSNRREEARLCTYIEGALESLYASEYGPDVPVAFDVHNERRGSELENLDVIAVHWRSSQLVELVGVETKLDFSPKLVLQATNYKRFAHRVWAAVPVTSDEPGLELREYDPLLFEYVLEQGIGILACRKRQGGAYHVWPIHWPRLNALDSVARDEFIDRYRQKFEKACVVKPSDQSWTEPRFR
jgi:hypothetical protein